MINIVIPMAGEGKRFRDAGYTVPKPFIDIRGKTMIEWAVESLYTKNARFILIAESENLLGYTHIVEAIKEKYPTVVRTVDRLTEGMASTTLLAKAFIDNNDPLLIGGCDQKVDIPIKNFIEDAKRRNLKGSLMTFYATHPKWSYAKVGEDGLVTETKEKVPISTHANVGLYYFAKGKDFVGAATEMIENNDRVNNEFYVAPVYNYLIRKGEQIGIFEILESQMHGLGTPEDLSNFMKRFKIGKDRRAMIAVLTHRGLDPSRKNFFTESSYEAFKNHLQRGFGVEFDVNFSKDKKIVIFHDDGLERMSGGKDKRLLSRMTLSEIKKIRLGENRIPDFNELMDLIIKYYSRLNALHLKGKFQDKKYLDILVTYLQTYREHLGRLVVFDVKTKTARYLKRKLPNLILAPSVAHPFDRKRYNASVKNTLVSMEEAISNRDLFDWILLDEWDRRDEQGGLKTLYERQKLARLKKCGFQIALISPELHSTSPGLAGGEVHQDGQNKKTLFKRMKEIIGLKPDAICTDYPDVARQLSIFT